MRRRNSAQFALNVLTADFEHDRRRFGGMERESG
jgi:hypothetical protein